jgi:hypothetical protein
MTIQVPTLEGDRSPTFIPALLVLLFLEGIIPASQNNFLGSLRSP